MCHCSHERVKQSLCFISLLSMKYLNTMSTTYIPVTQFDTCSIILFIGKSAFASDLIDNNSDTISGLCIRFKY